MELNPAEDVLQRLTGHPTRHQSIKITRDGLDPTCPALDGIDGIDEQKRLVLGEDAARGAQLTHDGGQPGVSGVRGTSGSRQFQATDGTSDGQVRGCGGPPPASTTPSTVNGSAVDPRRRGTDAGAHTGSADGARTDRGVSAPSQ